ncbi:MAG: hypothetical protein WCQ77_03640 [Planctomycetota bacterium]
MAKLLVSNKGLPSLLLLARYHFWLLALVVPLLLLPMLAVAQNTLQSQITAVQAQIKSYIDSLKAVCKIPQHPNDSWSNEIDNSTMRVKRETFAEWKKFWDSQQAFRTWPDSLGADFVGAVEAIKPDGKLSRKWLERYQNNVRSLVRELPTRMGVADAMSDGSAAGGSRPGGLPEPMRPGMGLAGGISESPIHFFSWSTANQQLIYHSFDWDRPPSTTQVLLAQEELWVYGLLCDIIARFNKPGTGPHNVAMMSVDQLLVGYPAAEDNPGGVNGGRITVTATPQAGGPGMGSGMGPPAMVPGRGPPGAEGVAVGRPPHRRFRGIETTRSAPQPEGDAAVIPDELLKNWIYVDFNGKPLNAAQLVTAADSQMIHLMPFVLQCVIDQRQIDALLADLAAAPLPIDVRQIRINTTAGAAKPAATGGRINDVHLELRGTVGLATRPNEQAVGLEPGQADGDASGDALEKPAPAPKAAASAQPGRERMAS